MAYASAARQTISLDEGDVVVLLPAKLSQRSIEMLQLQLRELSAGLISKNTGDDQSNLRGLAGLAAYVANQ